MSVMLQTIHSVSGQPEYVLLPYDLYLDLQDIIEEKYHDIFREEDYEDFSPADFIKNPIALMRMRAGITQTELAKRLNVSQAYISKIEVDTYKVSDSLLQKVKKALKPS